ncbi:MAG TPA: TRAM domain-containing protein [Planctomycetota bacterium]|nr:TRAM domain-containing protein [Planctomycetota bacterium]
MNDATELVRGEIVGTTSTGDGIARRDGKVVFIPGALPGETVLYKVFRTGASFDRATLMEVLTPVGRRLTPCPHDKPGGCGGCSLLHADRPTSGRIKRLLVQDALERTAGLSGALVEETRLPGPDLGYRNHARFGVDVRGRLTYVTRSEGREAKHRREFAVDSCSVLHPSLEALRAALDGRCAGAEAVELRVGVRTGDRLTILHGVKQPPRGLDVASHGGSLALAFRGRIIPAKGMPWIHETVAGRRFRITAPSFFQVNTDGAEQLVALVREMLGAGSGAKVIDLYAGVGLFTLGALSDDVDVIAAEIDEFSVNDFKTNAADRPRAKIRNLAVDEFLADFKPGRDVFDAAIVNPPRGGAGDATLARLAQLRIPRLAMVSCDPGSLARDVKALAVFGYALKRAVPVDQFPGTPHVETVALLEL